MPLKMIPNKESVSEEDKGFSTSEEFWLIK